MILWKIAGDRTSEEELCMQLKEWSEDEISYELSNDYSIRKTESDKWGIYFFIYYNIQYIGFFREDGFKKKNFLLYV